MYCASDPPILAATWMKWKSIPARSPRMRSPSASRNRCWPWTSIISVPTHGTPKRKTTLSSSKRLRATKIMDGPLVPSPPPALVTIRPQALIKVTIGRCQPIPTSDWTKEMGISALLCGSIRNPPKRIRPGGKSRLITRVGGGPFWGIVYPLGILTKLILVCTIEGRTYGSSLGMAAVSANMKLITC